jgi:hypothetical protein
MKTIRILLLLLFLASALNIVTWATTQAQSQDEPQMTGGSPCNPLKETCI